MNEENSQRIKKIFPFLFCILGVGIIATPYYIYPVCEYLIYQRMICSYTALAEAILGLLIIGLALGMFFLKTRKALLGISLVLIFLGILVILGPSLVGYCPSPEMPCHKYTVPALRIEGAVLSLLAFFSFFVHFRQRTQHR